MTPSYKYNTGHEVALPRIYMRYVFTAGSLRVFLDSVCQIDAK